MTDPPPDTLAAALGRYDIELPEDQIAQLDAYRRLLWDFNRKLNLTRHTDYEKFVTRDVVDSLQLAALLQPGEEVLDVGTGGGVPGVMIAVMRPDVHISLCESVAKRAKATAAILQRLKLPIAVYHRRAQALLEQSRYDVLIARAVAPLWKLLTWLAPHWSKAGRLLVIKGSRWAAERAAARERGLLHNLQLRCAARYTTPGTNAENVILKLWPKQSSQR